MANTPYNPPLFGISPNPAVKNIQLTLTLSQIADTTGLDLISIQDHPYNPTFLDTWTLLAVLGARTQQVRLQTNVVNLPLRPPAMLAKSAATLDILTNGRVELGLGAGAFWEGIMDTFIFWPIGNEETQTHLFAEEVVPALRSAIGQK
jgi:alkanesulfonate monooxygenase SsuD/methylene tetrahydromethanopterin reductase-like flavin-dependent oxidoreductase (luciferase family)